MAPVTVALAALARQATTALLDLLPRLLVQQVSIAQLAPRGPQSVPLSRVSTLPVMQEILALR
jgi:hypothetical protein